MNDSATIGGTKKTGISRLFEIAGQRKFLLFVSAFLAFIFALCSLIPYILVFYIIKELAQSTADFSNLSNYLVWAAGVILVSIILFFISAILSHIAAFNILYELRKFIVLKIGQMTMGSLTNRSSGAFKKILYDDVERIELFIAHQIPDLVKGIALPLVTIAYLFSHDWRLALISFAPFFLLMIWLPFIYGSKKNGEIITKYHESQEAMNAGIVEYVRAIPVMKIFGQSAETFDKYGTTVKSFQHFVNQWVRNQSPAFAIFMSFISNATLPILALGLFLYFRDGLSLSVLFLFLLLGSGYIKQLFVLQSVGPQISLINRGVRQIDDLLNETTVSYHVNEQEPKHYSIRFDQVSFAYEKDNHVLQNIGFEVKERSITALVGPSGAGKSTVGQLIARFWDVTKGTIFIGDIPLQNYPQKQLMDMVSFVFQDSFMFQQSMFENIRMGMNKTREEVEQAAKYAQLHDLIISLPNGYDTLFGEAGVHLSGGEQQRFQIARAMLKDAPILILDEATAFADPENEHKIQDAISKLIQNKTVIIIAHRLRTITNVDQIIVFNQGKIEGKGTHQELLQENTLYQKMWNASQQATQFQL